MQPSKDLSREKANPKNKLTEPGISLSVSFVICAKVGMDPFLTDFRELSLPRSRDFL